MKSIRLFIFAALMSFVIMFATINQQERGVEAGKKKAAIQTAILAALLLHGGKKIMLPLPIPLPVP